MNTPEQCSVASYHMQYYSILRLLLYLTVVNSKVKGGVLYRTDLLDNTGLLVRHFKPLKYNYNMVVKEHSIYLVVSVTEKSQRL